MIIIQELFGFHGRLSRLPYLGYGALLFVVWATPWAIVFYLTSMDSYYNDKIIAGSLVVALAAFVAGAWCGAALIVKRLHDMGMSAWNLVWILSPSFAAGWVGRNSEFAILPNLMSVGILLWLSATPGQPHDNDYGPLPKRFTGGKVSINIPGIRIHLVYGAIIIALVAYILVPPSPHSPAELACVENAARTGRTNEAMRVLIDICREKFQNPPPAPKVSRATPTTTTAPSSSSEWKRVGVPPPPTSPSPASSGTFNSITGMPLNLK